MDNSTSPISGFNPITQNITFFAADGITPITTTIAEIDTWRGLLLTSSISYSIQIGASLIMFVVVLLLTQPQKRTTPLFYINTASLLICAIESTLIVSYYPSEYTEFYTWFSYDISLVPRSTTATNIAANTVGVLFLFAIETSLLLQTRVICETMTDWLKWCTFGFSFLVALVAVGLNFGQMVMNNIAVLNQNFYRNPAWNWIGKSVDISYTFSIWFFCVIFVSKLVVTMWRRKKMGMKQWGPMQIICIMGGCTMIIPSIFSVLEFYASRWYWEPGPIGHTLVAIMLPLSSIWASASLEGRVKNTYEPEARRKQFFGSFASTLTDKMPMNKMAASIENGSRKDSAAPSAPLSPLTSSNMDVESGKSDAIGWEGQRTEYRVDGGSSGSGSKAKKIVSQFFGGGKGKGGNDAQVMVERTYSVRSSGGLDGVRQD